MTDMVANATKISSLAAKNSCLDTIMVTIQYFSMLTINNGYFLTHYVLLENCIERSFLLKH